MLKRTLLGVVGVIVGIPIGMIFMMSLHMASTLVYPLPEGVDFMSQSPDNIERLQAWFATLPAGAFILAALSHGLGCMMAAIVATFISGRTTPVPAGFIGVFFTVSGIMNLSSIPHPAWFPFVDIPIYMILAIAAWMLLKRKSPDAGTVATDVNPTAT